MKIYYLSASRLASSQANAVHVMNMCAAMADEEIETVLFCQAPVDPAAAFAKFGLAPSFEIAGVVPSPIPFLGGALYATRCNRLAGTLPKPDLWYGRHVYSTALVAFKGQPFVFEAHGIHRRWVVRRLMRTMVRLPNLKAFVVISDALKQDCLAAYPELAPNKIIVAHDAARPLPSAPSRISRGPKSFHVGYVGHLYPGKGMEIVAAVASRLPDVCFHVVGGTEEDLKYWKRVCESGNVIFHGHVSHSEVGGYLAGFDAVLLPNQPRVALAGGKADIGRWTSPLKMFEYMSAGLAIISSDLPVLREVLTDGDTAILCPPTSIHAWVGAITRLRGSETLRMQLGENARRLFLQRYTWRRRVQNVLSFLGDNPKALRPSRSS